MATTVSELRQSRVGTSLNIGANSSGTKLMRVRIEIDESPLYNFDPIYWVAQEYPIGSQHSPQYNALVVTGYRIRERRSTVEWVVEIVYSSLSSLQTAKWTLNSRTSNDTFLRKFSRDNPSKGIGVNKYKIIEEGAHTHVATLDGQTIFLKQSESRIIEGSAVGIPTMAVSFTKLVTKMIPLDQVAFYRDLTNIGSFSLFPYFINAQAGHIRFDSATISEVPSSSPSGSPIQYSFQVVVDFTWSAQDLSTESKLHTYKSDEGDEVIIRRREDNAEIIENFRVRDRVDFNGLVGLF